MELQKALSNVSFSLKKEKLLVLGPNGAGKSTLMKIICCYLKQDKGNVTICDVDTKKQDILVKSHIGYLPENNALYNDMYIKEYLTFIGGLYNVININERLLQIISKVGLDKVQQKKIKELSKGYQQRVGIASALIHNPEVLILDEPTTGLDPNQLIEIRNLIKKLAKKKQFYFQHI